MIIDYCINGPRTVASIYLTKYILQLLGVGLLLKKYDFFYTFPYDAILLHYGIFVSPKNVFVDVIENIC